MKSRTRELTDRAVAAMSAAIEIYNKPGFPYRSESFAILAVNGWELLLKAKWLAIHQNKESSLYVRERRRKANGEWSKNSYIRKTRSGASYTYGLDYLASQLVHKGILDPSAHRNIEVMLEFRDCAVHFYSQSPAFRTRLYEIGAACVKNFTITIDDWFKRGLSELDLHLMPLAFIDFPTNVQGSLLNLTEKNFLAFLDEKDEAETEGGSPYSVSVSVNITFIKSGDRAAIPARVTNDPSATPIRLTDDEFATRYPWDYKTLTDRCKQRYNDFKQNQDYHRVRQLLETKPSFAMKRFLHPNNPKSAKTMRYNPSILSEFDKYYAKKDGS